MNEVTIALGIISFLLATILSIVSYLYISQRRDMNHRIGRLEKALVDSRKELEDKIEKHYAYKSETLHLRELMDILNKDLDGIKEEVSKGNDLSQEILLVLQRSTG